MSVVKYNGCASLAINQQMVKRKPFNLGRRREVFLSWIQWIMGKKTPKELFCTEKKLIWYCFHHYDKPITWREKSLFEAGRGSVGAIFIEGRLGGQ